MTAVRSAIRTAALRRWRIRAKDVSTAFLNADYHIKGEVLTLKPPNVHVKAGLVEESEYWLAEESNLRTQRITAPMVIRKRYKIVKDDY